MADVDKLKLLRRNQKGQLTRTLTAISSLLQDTDVDFHTLNNYMAKAEEQFNKVELKHEALIEITLDDDVYKEEEQWMTVCENEYIQILTHGKKLLDRKSDIHADFKSPIQEPPPHTECYSAMAPTHPMSTTPSPAAKMARMKFPVFSGDVRDYRRFKELFIHCTEGLSEIECHFQLTESMSRKYERDMVKSCINTQRAWEILDESFGDQDKVIDAILNDIDNLKTYEVKGKVNLTAMGHFVQTLQVFETQAEAIGLSGELNSKIMLNQIRQKLPEEHRIEYFKSIREHHTPDTLGGLVKWLYSHLLLLDKAKPSSKEKPVVPFNQTEKTTRSSNGATSTSTNYQQQANKQQHKPKCPLHRNSNTHYLKSCYHFRRLSLKEKYDVMRQNKICFRCGHNNCVAGESPYNLSLCQFVVPCKIQSCQSDQHFTAICPVIHGSNQQGTSNHQLNNDAEPFVPNNEPTKITTVVNNEKSKLQNVLPTVMGYLKCGNTRRLVRILLDSGSQATLVREGIFEQTDRDVYQDYDLSLVGGSKITRKLRLLDCMIEDINGNWSSPLRVTEINQPCGKAPIIRSDDLQDYNHLRDLDIHEAASETIDLLIGADNTHLMIWQHCVRNDSANDPIAVKCPFGWYIQGGQQLNATSMVNYIIINAIRPSEEFIGLKTVGFEPKYNKCSTQLLDDGAVQMMQDSVTEVADGSYDEQLPWKKPTDELPDNHNYEVAANEPSIDNIIDIVSRAGKASDMTKLLEGPQFLKREPESCTSIPVNLQVDLYDTERKKSRSRKSNTLAIKSNNVAAVEPVDVTKFSSWSKQKMIYTDRISALKDLPKRHWLKNLAQQIPQYPSPKIHLLLDHPKVHAKCRKFNIQWHFGPAGGPHHHGAIEHPVQEVKKGMRILETLTAMSSSSLDHPLLTPNHLLISRGDLQCLDVPCDKNNINFKKKRRELCNSMVNGFWQRWIACLHTLTPRKKWQETFDSVKIGDIVLVVGESKKRGTWKMAQIMSVFPGRDELVRVVDVKFADGTVMRRPVTKLIMLMKF